MYLFTYFQLLGNLKTINLRNSKYLQQTPDFTGIPNLEKLDLEGCINLVKVHDSLGLLKKLSYVTLEDCRNLKSLPGELEMNSLKCLILSGCTAVRKLPDFGESMTNLFTLALEETPIAQLPPTIGYLTGLNSLRLRECRNIVSLPNTFSNLKSLKRLNLSGCSKFYKLPDNLHENEALEFLNVSDTAIREVPSSIVHLKNLVLLSFHGCKGLSNSESSRFSLSKFFRSGTDPIPMKLILPSFSGLSSLKKLDLSYCNLYDGSIPDDLGCLSSLVTLDISGNKFVNLHDGCISKLLKLERLVLSSCQNLQSLPKLPPNVHVVNASDCDSMKPLSNPQEIWNHLASFAFDKLQDANPIKTLLVSPGNEIPSTFFYQNYFDRDIQYLKDNYIWADSTASISINIAQLRQRYDRSEWWGILVCLVIEDVVSSKPSQDYRVGWISKFPATNNILRQLCQKLLEHGFISGVPNSKHPHLLVLYIPGPSSRWSYVQDKFELIFFSSSLKSKLVIKKCGWRILCKEDAQLMHKKLSECNTSSTNQSISRGNCLSSSPPSFTSYWRWISCLKVPRCYKTFLLEVLCERLPTIAKCRFCSMEGTATIHVLRDCRRARAIWVQMVPPQVHDEFFSISLHDWMHRFLRRSWLPNNCEEYDADCLRFSVTTFVLWKDGVHEGDSLTYNRLYSLIKSLVKELTSSTKRFIKLNVDGCCMDNPRKAGYGGLFRDVEGNWHGGFYGSLGFTTTMKAELYAICQGLVTAWDLGYRNILVETDSLEAINHIEEANIEHDLYGSLVSDIRSLMQRNWSLNLVHSVKEDNGCADILSKLGAEQHEVYCYHAYPPQQLKWALRADSLHVQLPCM
ncbi:hypothetical protein TSUD_330570 [Trifolium subterraneum]|nr:hypothetical protein TSUD_330570 [Trifolium subterraneum]